MNAMNAIFRAARVTFIGLALASAAGCSGQMQAASSTTTGLVGTWCLSSASFTGPSAVGGNEKGILTFDSNNNLSFTLIGGDRSASGHDRLHGQGAELKKGAEQTIAYFGTYSVAGTVLSIQVTRHSFPNFDGTTLTRNIALNGDVLTFSNPGASTGAKSTLTWKRTQGACT